MLASMRGEPLRAGCLRAGPALPFAPGRSCFNFFCDADHLPPGPSAPLVVGLPGLALAPGRGQLLWTFSTLLLASVLPLHRRRQPACMRSRYRRTRPFFPTSLKLSWDIAPRPTSSGHFHRRRPQRSWCRRFFGDWRTSTVVGASGAHPASWIIMGAIFSADGEAREAHGVAILAQRHPIP